MRSKQVEFVMLAVNWSETLLMSQSSLLLIRVLGVVCKNYYIHSIDHLLGLEILLLHISVGL